MRWLDRVDTGSRCGRCVWVETQQFLTQLKTGRGIGECAYSAAGGGERSWRGADLLKCFILFVVAELSEDW